MFQRVFLAVRCFAEQVLGSPSKDEFASLKTGPSEFKFPAIAPTPWSKVFKNKAQADAIDLVAHFLRYDPSTRLDAFEVTAPDFRTDFST
mgnify:CR=1 FL=1